MEMKISKGQMFTVSTAIDDERLKKLKRTPEIIQEAILVGAEYWHANILPQHFKKDASPRYGYAQRSKDYLRKKGTKPDLIMSGSLARDVKGRATFKTMRTAIELKMHARVLNLVPNMPQNSADHYVRIKSKDGMRNYPNLKREIKIVTAGEAEAVAKVVVAELERRLSSEQAYYPTDGV